MALGLLAIVALIIPVRSRAGLLWAQTYNGAGDRYDAARSVAAHPNRGLIVTGSSTEDTVKATTIFYAPDGTARWVEHSGTIPYAAAGAGAAVAPDGAIYVAGQQWMPAMDTTDIFLIKYDTSGHEEWVRVFDGFGYDDSAYRVAVSPAGDILVLGTSIQLDDADFILLRYTPAGDLLWNQRFDGPGHYDDYPTGMIVDAHDNIYVIGYVDNTPGPFYDWVTLKYASDGMLQWTRLYNGPGDDNDFPSGIALSPDERGIYITGRATQADPYGAQAIVTIKYDQQGNEMWIRTYSEGPGDGGHAVVVDSGGDVFVTGHTGSPGLPPPSTSYDCLTLSYTSDGLRRWVHRYDGPSHDNDLGYQISMTDRGTLFVVGLANQGVSPWRGDVLVLTYSTTGALLSEWVYELTQWFDSPATSLVVGDTLYVAGRTARGEAVASFDYLTIKYADDVVPVVLSSFEALVSQGGVTLTWRTATAGLGSFNVERRDVAYTDFTRINASPITQKPEDPRVSSYRDGNVLPGSEYDYRIVAIDRRGASQYVGQLRVTVPRVAPGQVTIDQNLPNPFSSTTTITFETPAPGPVSLLIYDAAGRSIRTLLNALRTAGLHSVVWNAQDEQGCTQPSGVYFVRLRTVAGESTSKLLLVR